MGVLPATLFLLSVWHSEWTRPWFCLLLPHHHVKSCSVCISKMQIHIVFFPYFPLLFLPFYLKHVHASVSSICVTLPSILITWCSAKATFSLLGKNRYLFSPGSDSFFLVLSFHLFILSGRLYSFPSLFFFPSAFCSHLSSPVSPDFFILFSSPTLCFHLFSLLQPPSVLACVAKIQPWGYIASFMWGPVVTLKACNVVCRFASAQL